MSFIAKVLVLFCLISLNLSYCFGLPVEHNNETEVVLVHVIFRHGERTTYKFYPNDPNRNVSFYPIGLGGLTNHGKMGEYKLGQYLRHSYDDLLGPHYLEEMLEARSTDTTRTIMSAQLVLAGLFPPSAEQIWNNEILWQPIPVFYKKKPEEDLLHPECDKKLAILKDLPHRIGVRDMFVTPHRKLFKFIEEKSGASISNVHELVEFYFIVQTEDELNMTIPDWVREIYPEPLRSTSALIYAYHNYDDEVRKINTGYLIKKIIDDTKLKINSHVDYKNKKMYLYSGHESTLGYLLYNMDILKLHIPGYSSAIILEVHRNSHDDYFIKILYRGNPAEDPEELQIPGCAVLCPVDQFILLQKNNLPSISVEEACKLDVNGNINKKSLFH